MSALAGVNHKGPVRIGWTPLEIEQYELFGQIPEPKAGVVHSTVPDKRERRDFTTRIEQAMTENRKPGWLLRLAKRIEKEPQPT